MKFSIFFSLLLCFILFTDDVKTAFTIQDCLDCCNGLSERPKFHCEFSCHKRWSRNQDYNSRNECNRSCTLKLGACRQPCLDDCAERYEEIPPGVRPPDRRDKARQADREAREAQGIYGRSRPTKDPNAPKRTMKPKKRKNDDEGGSSSAVA